MKIQFEWKKTIGPVLYVTLRGNQFGLCICHHDPKRCIPFFGLEKYLCSRCLGIFLGSMAGICLQIFHVHIPAVAAVILMIPLLVDGFSQAFGLRESNNYLRISTGFLCGLGILSYPYS